MIVQGNWGELLLPGLRTIYDLHIKSLPDFMGQLFNVQSTTKKTEESLGVGALGLMEAWTGTVAYEDPNKGYKASYTQAKFSKGLQIEEEMVRYDQYNEIKKRTKKLATSANYTRQVHGAGVFNNAFATVLGPDGKVLCATDHPYSPSDSTAQSNKGTTALSLDAVDTTYVAMTAWTDDKGNKVAINPDTLIVPPGLRKTALEIVKSPKNPTNADNAINVYEGEFKVIVLPFLTDTNNWFMADSTLMKDFLNWYDSRKPDFSDTVDFDTEVAKYKVVGSWAYGWDHWQFLYGHLVA
jgi:phage major head subunit gpT-like protein